MARLASASRAVDLRKIVLLGRDKSILEEVGYDMLSIEVGDNWMSEILNWLGNDVLPEDQVKARVVQKRALNFYLNHGVLYKRGFAGPDLRCVGPAESRLILEEIHGGTCGNHSGGRSLADKILRQGITGPRSEKTPMNTSGNAMSVKGSPTFQESQLSSKDHRWFHVRSISGGLI